MSNSNLSNFKWFEFWLKWVKSHEKSDRNSLSCVISSTQNHVLCIALVLKLFIVEREWGNCGKFNFSYFLLICRILASHAEAHLNKRIKCVKHNSAVCECTAFDYLKICNCLPICISLRFFFLNLISRVKNQNLRLVCQNLTGITYLQFIWP